MKKVTKKTTNKTSKKKKFDCEHEELIHYADTILESSGMMYSVSRWTDEQGVKLNVKLFNKYYKKTILNLNKLMKIALKDAKCG